MLPYLVRIFQVLHNHLNRSDENLLMVMVKCVVSLPTRKIVSPFFALCVDRKQDKFSAVLSTGITNPLPGSVAIGFQFVKASKIRSLSGERKMYS
jgi:hypothetical protein